MPPDAPDATEETGDAAPQKKRHPRRRRGKRGKKRKAIALPVAAKAAPVLVMPSVSTIRARLVLLKQLNQRTPHV